MVKFTEELEKLKEELGKLKDTNDKLRKRILTIQNQQKTIAGYLQFHRITVSQRFKNLSKTLRRLFNTRLDNLTSRIEDIELGILREAAPEVIQSLGQRMTIMEEIMGLIRTNVCGICVHYEQDENRKDGGWCKDKKTYVFSKQKSCPESYEKDSIKAKIV